jgi:hypothetical protein
MKKKIIVVLGMHRSGTSAITRSLEILGVGLGKNLYPAACDNPKGFWEDRECLEINEALLARFNSAYDSLGLTWREVDDPEVNKLKLKASALIARKLDESNNIWGFKDPRTCRLLSFWCDVFKVADCTVSYVIALRNPASVVASLGKRNNIAAEKSYLLWFQHTLLAILQTRGEKRVVVNYDDLLDFPFVQVKRIAHALSLDVPCRDSLEVLDFEREFLDVNLRHTRYSSADLIKDRQCPGIVVAAYDILDLAAHDEVDIDSDSVSDSVTKLGASLADFAPIFNYINNLERQRIELLSSVSDLTESELVREDMIMQHEEKNARCHQQLLECKRVAAEHEEKIAWLSECLSASNQGLLDLRHELRNVFASTSWRITGPVRYLSRVFVGRLVRIFK